MTLASNLFVLVFVAVGGYVAIVKSRIDGFTWAYLGLAFYFSPALLPYGKAIGGRYVIPPAVHYLGILLFCSLFLVDAFVPWRRLDLHSARQTPDPDSVLSVVAVTSLTVALGISVLVVAQFDFGQLGAPKASIVSPISGAPYTAFQIIATVGVAAATLRKQYGITAAIIALLLLNTVLFQVRSTTAFAIAIAAFVIIRESDPSIRQRFVYGSIGSACSVAFILFDLTKYHLLHGNWGILRRNAPAYVGEVFFNNNAQQLVQITGYTIRYDVTIRDPVPYVVWNVISAVPFAETLFGVSGTKFGHVYKSVMFPAKPGIGGSTWAEWYAIGDVPGLLFAVVFFLATVYTLSTHLDAQSPFIRLFSYSILPYLTVYVHRLSISEIVSKIILFLLMSGALVAGAHLAIRVVDETPSAGSGLQPGTNSN